VGETPSIGGDNPVPVNATCPGTTPGLLVVTSSVAEVAPVACGAKITPTEQELPAATLTPQVVAPSEKLAAPTPKSVKPGFKSGDPPLLEIVSVRAALGTSTCSPPNAIVTGATAIVGGFSPVPCKCTPCARNASEISRVPCSVVAIVGENSTVIPHDEFGASWLPQSLTTEKSPFDNVSLTDVPIEVSGSPPLFVKVTVSGGDTCPTTVGARVRLVVESTSVGPSTPVPLNAADCTPTLSVTVRIPVAAPACLGVKSSVTAQPVFAASVLPQLLPVRTNGALTAIDVIVSELPPVFCTLKLCVADAVPTACVPKLALAGVSVTLAVASPLPVSGTNNWPPATLAWIATVAGRAPVSVGVKLTFTWQVAFFASAIPTQVFVSLKSPDAAPVNTTPVTVSAVVPVAFNVTTCAAVVTPTVVFANVNEAGLTVAVVTARPDVAGGICHTPRPYVPAVSTAVLALADVVVSVVTGASGSPVPYCDQHAVAAKAPQEPIARVA
jgi:hypothetical protein